MKKLVTVIDISKRFDVHPETVRLWVRRGKIPCIRPTRNTIRFDLTAVEQALRKPVSRDKSSKYTGTAKKWNYNKNPYFCPQSRRRRYWQSVNLCFGLCTVAVGWGRCRSVWAEERFGAKMNYLDGWKQIALRDRNGWRCIIRKNHENQKRFQQHSPNHFPQRYDETGAR